MKFWILTQNNIDVLLFSHQTRSLKHDFTEAHKHNFEIHNIVLFSQGIPWMFGILATKI